MELLEDTPSLSKSQEIKYVVNEHKIIVPIYNAESAIKYIIDNKSKFFTESSSQVLMIMDYNEYLKSTEDVGASVDQSPKSDFIEIERNDSIDDLKLFYFLKDDSHVEDYIFYVTNRYSRPFFIFKDKTHCDINTWTLQLFFSNIVGRLQYLEDKKLVDKNLSSLKNYLQIQQSWIQSKNEPLFQSMLIKALERKNLEWFENDDQLNSDFVHSIYPFININGLDIFTIAVNIDASVTDLNGITIFLEVNQPIEYEKQFIPNYEFWFFGSLTNQKKEKINISSKCKEDIKFPISDLPFFDYQQYLSEFESYEKFSESHKNGKKQKTSSYGKKKVQNPVELMGILNEMIHSSVVTGFFGDKQVNLYLRKKNATKLILYSTQQFLTINNTNGGLNCFGTFIHYDYFFQDYLKKMQLDGITLKDMFHSLPKYVEKNPYQPMEKWRLSFTALSNIIPPDPPKSNKRVKI